MPKLRAKVPKSAGASMQYHAMRVCTHPGAYGMIAAHVLYS